MLSNKNIRLDSPGSPEEFYIIHENLDNFVDSILKKLNLKPLEITLLGGEGGANLKILLKDKAYVLKIVPYDGILQVAEYFFRKVLTLNIPVPIVYVLDVSKSIIPFEFMLMDFIDGETIKAIDTSELFEAGEIIGNNIKKVHSIVIRDFNKDIASFNTWTSQKWEDRLRYYVTTLPDEFQNIGLSDEDISFIKSLITNPSLITKEPHLLHGDLHFENCLFKKINNHLVLTGIIDPNTTFGDPMLDIAIAEVLAVKWNTEEFYKGFRVGYGELSKDEQARVNILRVLFLYWLTSWQCFEKNNIERLKQRLREFLDAIE